MVSFFFISWCALKDEKKLRKKSCLFFFHPLCALLLAEFPSSRSPISVFFVVASSGLQFFSSSQFSFIWRGVVVAGGSASRKVSLGKKALRSSLCIFMYFFRVLIFFAISLFVVRSRFGSLNVSYRWIATLRRLGCNLFFAACSFFRFESFSWEILHQIYWIFFHRALFNHFSKSLPLCRRAVMLSRCRWCATSQGMKDEVIYYDIREGSTLKQQSLTNIED